MTTKELLIIVAFAALVSTSEVDDIELKKRGVSKATSLNSIPTGAQKQDYTYSIYTQNPSSQSSTPNQSYQSQVPNSFYPSQASSQYYQSNTPVEQSSGYAPQSQINILPPASSSQFVPLNFVPSPGYQSKYQVIPPKSNGNIQLAIVQQPQSFQTPSLVPYQQTLFTPNPTHQVNPQNSLLSSLSPQGHFNIAPNYQPLSLGSSYLGQPSTMLLFAQPNPSLYNNLLYPNPVQSFYNYYPSNSQAKYSPTFASQPPSEYDKLQITVPQNVPKEDNDIGAHSSEYAAASDANANYKNAYSASRSSYAKL